MVKIRGEVNSGMFKALYKRASLSTAKAELVPGIAAWSAANQQSIKRQPRSPR